MTTKQPQDHKQPKDKPQRITVHGVEMTIDPKVFDDLDMVEYLYDLQNTEENTAGGFAIAPFLRKLTGDKYAEVKNALRDPETGRIGMETVGAFIQELMGQLNPNS